MNLLLILPILTATIDPNIEITKANCSDNEIEYARELHCNASGTIIKHCEQSSYGFCYNRQYITDEGKGANKAMVSLLCNEDLILHKGIELKFGTCFLEGSQVENPGVISCECSIGDKQWVCRTEELTENK